MGMVGAMQPGNNCGSRNDLHAGCIARSIVREHGGSITITSDGTVAKPFPDNIWLPQKAQSISELFLIYMVKPNTVIASVKPADVQTGASFQENDTFLVK